MKTLFTVFLILLILRFSQAQEVPGGIVYSDGKDAIYQEFATGKTTNLTADIKGFAVEGPLTISEDGLVLTWQQRNKFLARRLPDGNPYELSVKDNDKDIVLSKNIRNMSISPDCLCLAYELTEKGNFWVQTEPGIPGKVDKINYAGRAKMQPAPEQYPKYEKRTGQEYNAIMIIRLGGGVKGRCGNSAFYPPTFPFRETMGSEQVAHSKRDRVVESHVTSITTADIRPGLTLNVAETIKRFSIKRDAHFLAWGKNWQSTQQSLVALIYQTEKGWGPIEIRNPCIQYYFYNPNNPETNNPGVWEIPVSLKDCKGVAWKPDGSLTYLSGEKVFLLNANRIMDVIKNNGVTIEQKKVGVGEVVTIPVNGELIADGINGDQLHWVSDDIFLFRGKEGSSKSIYFWHQGKVERLCKAPEEFSFCDKTLIDFSETTPNITFGKSKIETQNDFSARFSVGGIRMDWMSSKSGFVEIGIGKWEKENMEELQYAFPAEANLEDINNPSRYNYFSKGASFGISVPLDQIIILKSGNRYAAIKPLTLLVYNSLEEMPPEMRRADYEKKWDWSKGPIDIYKGMTYEWKYWPDGFIFTPYDRNANEFVDKSLASTSGKGEALERISLGRELITPPEFYITVNNFKTEWEATGVHVTEKDIKGKKIKDCIEDVASILTSPLPDGSRCDYVVLQAGLKFEAITNPSLFKYEKSPSNSYMSCLVYINEIIILKNGDKYLAIRPIELKQKYKSFEDMPEELHSYLSAHLDPRSPRPSGKCIVYDWKYWPKFPIENRADSAKINTPTLE